MFQNLIKRHFTNQSVLYAKKKAISPCPGKKVKKTPQPCVPVVESCKKIKLPTSACKRGEDKADGHGGKSGFYKFLTCYICLPTIVVLSISKILHEEAQQRPEFKKYEYMRIRIRPFPWGDGNHSLFHNPCYNALPEGYEDDKCEDEVLEEIEKKNIEAEEKRKVC